MSSDYIALYDERILDLDEIIVPQVTTDVLNVNDDVSVGGKINGVDINQVDLKLQDMVDTKTDQTVGGKKTFTDQLTIKHGTTQQNAIISSFIGGVVNAAQTYMLSNLDYLSELYFGSNMGGNPYQDKNLKWKFRSDSGWDTAEFSIERGPFFTGGVWEKMMSFNILTLHLLKFECISI